MGQFFTNGVNNHSFTRRRDLLHLNKVEEFHKWLAEQGYQDLPLCPYEVIRMIHPEAPRGNTLIVWQRGDAKEHATIQGASYFAYLAWADKKDANDFDEVAEALSTSIISEEKTQRYINEDIDPVPEHQPDDISNEELEAEIASSLDDDPDDRPPWE